MAAELRTHLLDRVRQLEAEGFSREEAEHLAVTAMGHPTGTNRALLGHLFTHALGWTVLAALLIGGGGWWVWNNVPLPLPGVRDASWTWSDELSADDLRDILGYEYAPRGQMLAGTLRVPPRTEWVYVAITPVGSGAGRGSGYWSMHRLAPAPGLGPNRVRRAQVVLGSSVWETGRCGGNGLALYEDMRWPTEQGRIRGSPQCLATLPPRTTVEWVQSSWGRTSWTIDQMRSDHHRAARPIPMNTWTPLAVYGLNYAYLGEKQSSGMWREDGKGMKMAYLYSVMPAEQRMHGTIFPNEPASLWGRFDWKRHALGLPRPDLRLSR